MRWAVASAIAAAATTAVTILGADWGRIIIFGIVAAYLWFFAWVRKMEFKRISQLLAVGSNADSVKDFIVRDVTEPPMWRRVSNWIVGTTAVAVFVGVFILLEFEVKELWLRLSYVLGLILLAVRLAQWAKHRKDSTEVVFVAEDSSA